MSGTSAVNHYGAACTADDHRQSFMRGMSSSATDPTGAPMCAEAAYIGLLLRVRSCRLDGRRLTPVNGTGAEVLVLAAESAPAAPDTAQ